jgi:hypothetical protein
MIYCGRYPPPADHFRPTCAPPRMPRAPVPAPFCPLPPYPYPPGHPPTHNPPLKRPREPFVASKSLLKLAAPIPEGQRFMTYLFKSLPMNTAYPKLAANDGKDCLICFRSAFQSPHNVCQLDTCIALKRRQRGGENKRLHIDLTQEPWRSKPEAYWQPVITWLQIPAVSALIKPTAAFRTITPSSNWT